MRAESAAVNTGALTSVFFEGAELQAHNAAIPKESTHVKA
jgi:hypothetical protein